MTFLTVGASVFLAGAFAGAYPAGEEVIGSLRVYEVRPGESLMEIARDFDLGYNEITETNPGVDPFVPTPGSLVVIPAAWIVPPEATPGAVVINLSEMRLYYSFAADHEGTQTVVTLPVGIGSEGTDTPPGTYRIVEKEVHPPWHVPPSIRKERPWLPEVVPFGPDDPLGTHALRLSSHSIMIHGTNKPWGVGQRVSHGCIRLYPEDIERLYKLVPLGTEVTILREPVKVGREDDRVFVEVHAESEGDPPLDALAEAQRLISERGLEEQVDAAKLRTAVEQKGGVPVDITR